MLRDEIAKFVYGGYCEEYNRKTIEWLESLSLADQILQKVKEHIENKVELPSGKDYFLFKKFKQEIIKSLEG